MQLCARRRLYLLLISLAVSSSLTLYAIVTFFFKDSVSNSNSLELVPSREKLNFSYLDYDQHVPRIFSLPKLKQNTSSIFRDSLEGPCLIEGSVGESGCNCSSDWKGRWCSLPNCVALTQPPEPPNLQSQFSLRSTQRRVVLASPFNVEWEMLEARLHTLRDVVDVFILYESNYTSFGDPKPLRLLDRLRRGYLRQYQHRIVYVFGDSFPERARTDSWYADGLGRRRCGTQGVRRQVRNLHADDLVIIADMDELPTRQLILFFRLHDGLTYPIQLLYRRTVFGFFLPGGVNRLSAAASFGFVCVVLDYDLSELRRALLQDRSQFVLRVMQILQRYKLRTSRSAEEPATSRIAERSDSTRLPELDDSMLTDKQIPKILDEWSRFPLEIGSAQYPAGWHCSWCTTVDRMIVKLVSAQADDGTRWGDYPARCTQRFISDIIARGVWFDFKNISMSVDVSTSAAASLPVAPNYFLQNRADFRYLLSNTHQRAPEAERASWDLSATRPTAKMDGKRP